MAIQSTEVATTTSGLLSFIERAAKDPGFDVNKFSILLDRHEALVKQHQLGLYNQAYSAMQSELTAIVKSGRNPTFQKPYAKLEDLDAAARPVYSKQGFSVRYGTQDHQRDGWIYVTLTIAHDGGYSETIRLAGPLDLSSRGRTTIQSIGSTVTYLRRYLLQMALNLVPKDDPTDDDGEAARAEKAAGQADQTHFTEQLLDTVRNCQSLDDLNSFALNYKNDIDQLNAANRQKVRAEWQAAKISFQATTGATT